MNADEQLLASPAEAKQAARPFVYYAAQLVPSGIIHGNILNLPDLLKIICVGYYRYRSTVSGTLDTTTTYFDAPAVKLTTFIEHAAEPIPFT
mmetsp:Transcript_4416/g.10750  ORF Transcript_4416/g.10750 Transcript_4416/m.10750 type:complete len:92 (+) Transcript_4416:3146-3421(+)